MLLVLVERRSYGADCCEGFGNGSAARVFEQGSDAAQRVACGPAGYADDGLRRRYRRQHASALWADGQADIAGTSRCLAVGALSVSM